MEKKQKKKRKYWIGVLIAAPFLLAGAAYLIIAVYFTSHFYFGSFINGMDYTGKTVQEVENVLAQDIQKYKLTIWELGDKKEVLTAEDVGLVYVSDGKVEQLLENQNPFLWPVAYFREEVYEMSVTTAYNKEKLKEKINNLECYKESNIIIPQDAYYVYENGTYSIVDEVEGTQLKKNIVYKLARKAIENAETEIFLEAENAYKKPKIYQDNKNLVKLVKTMNKYLGVTITYDFADRSEVLEGSKIHDWLTITQKEDGSYEVTFDEVAVRQYIDELCVTYNTFGQTRQFRTWDGSFTTVKGGDYGWLISRSVETEALIEVIKKGKSVTREPIYLQTAYNRNKEDIGNTYVEINLTAQHMWYFKNGKCLVSTPIVSGNISRNYHTPTGVFQITYKARNQTLTGENYSTPVNYWMPFYYNYGIHDAKWRNDFGGELYKTSGSHGCVNTPYENAEIIYENIEKGVPVVCYEKELSKEAMQQLQGGASNQEEEESNQDTEELE